MTVPSHNPRDQRRQAQRSPAVRSLLGLGARPASTLEAKSAAVPLASAALLRAAAAGLSTSGERIGVIDIGSNSIRLVVVEVASAQLDLSDTSPLSWTVLAEERSMTRLAHGLSHACELASEAMARSVDAIERFRATAAALGASVRAFATAAVRDASNRDDFLSLVKERTGLVIEVLSGLEEGALSYRGVARAFDLSRGRCAVVDIGGGSLEVVQSQHGVIITSASLPLGAVRLTEQFGGAEVAATDQWHGLRDHCERLLRRGVRVGDASFQLVVGCGGTFSTLATLVAAQRGLAKAPAAPLPREQGPLTRERIKSLIAWLRTMTLTERLRVPGLPSDRADIIIAGLTAIERLMKHLGIAHIHTHAGGVREGLLEFVIRQRAARVVSSSPAQASSPTSASGSASASVSSALGSVRALAQRCASGQAHSEHVAKLALQLYDQFAQESTLLAGLGDDPFERTMLEAAGIAHDIGTLVEYRRHHKHSATIIRHAELPGWTARQRELLAQVCRYHRRSQPSERHEEFAALTRKDQALVQRLAALLRVADGLDRSHTQVVQAINVKYGRGEIILQATASADIHAEVRAAMEKADLLEHLTSQVLVLVPVLRPGGGTEAPLIEVSRGLPGARLSPQMDPTHVHSQRVDNHPT